MELRLKQKEFSNQLKSGNITEDLLSGVLFSINKRAKNKRDKKQEYYEIATDYFCRCHSRFHNYLQKYKDEELKLYNMKDLMLRSLFTPIEIHIIRGKRYLYYEIGDYSFHSPDAIGYENLPIRNLQNFHTEGCDESKLLTSQFCKKVYDYVMNNYRNERMKAKLLNN